MVLEAFPDLKSSRILSTISTLPGGWHNLTSLLIMDLLLAKIRCDPWVKYFTLSFLSTKVISRGAVFRIALISSAVKLPEGN